MGFYIIYNSA